MQWNISISTLAAGFYTADRGGFLKYNRPVTGYNEENASCGKGSLPSLLLIVPPFMRPASPPLALASLKAFLNQEVPGSDIRCLDLNLLYFLMAMDWLARGTIKLKLYNWDHIQTAEMVQKAFRFLSSTTPTPRNMEEYHRQATIFLSFENIFNTFMSEMVIRTLASAPVPSGVSAVISELCSMATSMPVDIVGISVLFDSQMPMALLLAKRFRQTGRVKVFLGGAKFGVETHSDRLFHEPVAVRVKDRQYQFVAGEFIDGIISGEGEHALLHILRYPDLKQPGNIPNLTYLKNGKVVSNPAAVLEDLGRLPCPDFSDFTLDRYMCPDKILPLLTARGCPWGKCAFCTHHRSYKKYRQRPLDQVIGDIKSLADHHDVCTFNFLDEMIPPGRLRKLSERILEEGLDICYSAYGKPVRAFNQKTLKRVRDSGCRLILWGVESASQRILDRMNKGTNIDHVTKVINTAAHVGIKNLVFVMFGFPGESEEEFFETLSWLEKNSAAIHALSKGTFRLTDGSPVARNPDVFGITKIKEQEAPAFKRRILTFEMATSLQPQEAEELFRQNISRIEAVDITPRFGTYREHLLVYACHEDSEVNCHVAPSSRCNTSNHEKNKRKPGEFSR